MGILQTDACGGAAGQAVPTPGTKICVGLGLRDAANSRREPDHLVGAMFLADSAFHLTHGQAVLIHVNHRHPGHLLRGLLTDRARLASPNALAAFVAAIVLKRRLRKAS